MTAQELINLLEAYEPDAEVRLAFQPDWPFEHSLAEVVEVETDDGEQIIYLGEGRQIGYLPGDARDALGW